MNHARLKFDFGELVIEYSSLEDLEGKLDAVGKVAELVVSKVGPSLSQHAQRQPKPGYEDVYRFLPDGTVELVLFPTKKVQRVGLVLFAYDQAVSSTVIEKCTSIQNVTSNVLQSGPIEPCIGNGTRLLRLPPHPSVPPRRGRGEDEEPID